MPVPDTGMISIEFNGGCDWQQISRRRRHQWPEDYTQQQGAPSLPRQASGLSLDDFLATPRTSMIPKSHPMKVKHK